MKMRLEIQVPEPSILMQISSDPISLSSFSWWNHPIANSVEQWWLRRLGGEKREIEDQGRRSTDHFITPLHTRHVRYLRAGCFCFKFHSFNSNPLLYHFLIQKTCMSLIQIRCNYFSYPNAMNITSLFQIFGIYRFSLLERDIVRHSRLWT